MVYAMISGMSDGDCFLCRTVQYLSVIYERYSVSTWYISRTIEVVSKLTLW